MSAVKLHLTKDGSHTLINPELEESYHAYNGAWTESEFVYITSGLSYFLKQRTDNTNKLNMLEFGFGTGLNALLTLQQSLSRNLSVNYLSLEPFPIPAETALKLNYTEKLVQPIPQLFANMHAAKMDVPYCVTESFSLLKLQQKLHDATIKNKSIDLIYYDAFAPSKQPDAWEKPLFEKCFNALKSGGLLVSYCANGQFKRDLKSLGFKLDQCKGPMGRREITRAWKL
ncbi:MAG: tRNA (5-methylaminomethyl-2-thiouridine)(34)-methyltransferase MnmD [Parashewanella sp.]